MNKLLRILFALSLVFLDMPFANASFTSVGSREKGGQSVYTGKTNTFRANQTINGVLTVAPGGVYAYGTGGDSIFNYDAGSGVYYRVHKFTTTGAATFVAPTGLPVTTYQLLIVGGGGAGLSCCRFL